jgi:glycosyltransferase involved in cell wall biosynthesis
MISVVLATYDRAATLQRAIDSVLRQTLADWELIVVDDGSTDGTAELLAGIIDRRVIVCRHETNRGTAAAKNTGFDHIRGEWATTLDSDDEMVPEALQVMLECAERTGATAITCNGLDWATGKMTGAGRTSDGWITARETAQCRGDHWGLTRTSLLGDLRFDERMSDRWGLWMTINREAHRYYIHQALLIVNTEGRDRVTVANEHWSTSQKVRYYSIVGEDGRYLQALKEADPSRYRHTIVRVWAARALRPVIG